MRRDVGGGLWWCLWSVALFFYGGQAGSPEATLPWQKSTDSSQQHDGFSISSDAQDLKRRVAAKSFLGRSSPSSSPTAQLFVRWPWLLPPRLALLSKARSSSSWRVTTSSCSARHDFATTRTTSTTTTTITGIIPEEEDDHRSRGAQLCRVRGGAQPDVDDDVNNVDEDAVDPASNQGRLPMEGHESPGQQLLLDEQAMEQMTTATTATHHRLIQLYHQLFISLPRWIISRLITTPWTSLTHFMSTDVMPLLQHHRRLMHVMLAAWGPATYLWLDASSSSSASRSSSWSGEETMMRQFARMYAWALLGSTGGFYLFLYFISVGYAMGIALPVAAAYLYQGSGGQLFETNPALQAWLRWRPGVFPPRTWSQTRSMWVLLWSLRASVFFIWREYWSWSALHAKMVQVQETQAPSMLVQIVCWVVYALLYVAMASPCWFLLLLDRSTPRTTTPYMPEGILQPTAPTWRAVALTAASVAQGLGLGLETMADGQKSRFKRQHRLAWCHVGLFRYFTYPNYLGEWLFWTGTCWGGLLEILTHSATTTSSGRLVPSATTILMVATMLTGWIFITLVLHGAMQRLDRKHEEKYGANPAYVDFRETHTFWGPNLGALLRRYLLKRQQHRLKATALSSDMSDPDLSVESEAGDSTTNQTSGGLFL